MTTYGRQPPSSFVVSSMLAMGSGLLLGQIVEPLRNVRRVVLGLVANFMLMPLSAFVLARLLRLDHQFGIGLLVLGCAAGAPFLRAAGRPRAAC